MSRGKKHFFDKKEYIKRQIAKTNKKDYENYVVTRIIHLINDLDIKFVTQQFVKRPNGRALADLYLPQIHYFVEVDEMHHLSNEEADKKRDADFILMVGEEPRRVDVATSTLQEINDQIDIIVNEIQQKIKEKKIKGEFEPWNPSKEYDPITWIEKKEISVSDNVAFRVIVDVCKTFGLDYKDYQRAGAKHPYEKDTLLWFPKLFDNKDWKNSLDEEKGIIQTSCIMGDQEQRNHVDARLADPIKKRIVFAKVKDNLGDVKYRFRGVFRMDEKNTNYKNGVVWNKISNKTATYDYRNKI